MDVPAGVTQEEDHSGFLPLTSAVLAFVFLARRIQKPFLSLVDREVEYCLLINPSTLVGHIWAHKHIYIYIYIYIYILARRNPSLCDCTEIRTHVPTTHSRYTCVDRPSRSPHEHV